MKKPGPLKVYSRVLAIAAGLCALHTGAYAQQKHLSQQVSLFKNNNAFVRYTDSVRAEQGKSIVSLPQQAFLGTLWFSAGNSGITSASSVARKRVVKDNVGSMHDLLQSNVGKRVRLVLAYIDPVEATVTKVMDKYAVFKTKEKWITTGIDKIETIEFLDEPDMSSTVSERMLELNWADGRNSHELSYTYMCASMGWLPEYKIELQDDKTALLTLKAKIVNDETGLQDADINLMAGVPNFRFAGQADPLSAAEALPSWMGLQQGNAYKLSANEMFSNTLKVNTSVVMPDGSNASNTGVEGETNEDYYAYKLKHISLEKGGRGAYTLLESKVPYKDVYAVVIPSETQTAAREDQVYHSIQLTNPGNTPWTSGSAFLLKAEGGDIQPLAEDVMNYTCKGCVSNIKLTSAPDIEVKDKEQEVSRKQALPNASGHGSYDEVSVEATITIRNMKDKDIQLDVSRILSGTPQGSDASWQVVKQADRYNAENPSNEIHWQLSLKPAEEKVITYHYMLLVRR